MWRAFAAHSCPLRPKPVTAPNRNRRWLVIGVFIGLPPDVKIRCLTLRTLRLRCRRIKPSAQMRRPALGAHSGVPREPQVHGAQFAADVYRLAMAAHWLVAVPLTMLMLPSSVGTGLFPVQYSDPVTVLPATLI